MSKTFSAEKKYLQNGNNFVKTIVNLQTAKSDEDDKQIIRDEIAKQQKRKVLHKEFEKELSESGEPQISTSDPKRRQIMICNNITEVAYNVQTTKEHLYKRRQAIVSFFRGPVFAAKFEVT